jgi:hypothetical protein
LDPDPELYHSEKSDQDPCQNGMDPHHTSVQCQVLSIDIGIRYDFQAMLVLCSFALSCDCLSDLYPEICEDGTGREL